MRARQPLLSLIALPADGSESLFNHAQMVPGTHLRWSFEPALGFPEYFSVFRRTYELVGAEFAESPTPSEWGQPIAQLWFPAFLFAQTSTPLVHLINRDVGAQIAAFTNELHRRMTSQADHRWTESYRAEIPGLVELLDRLKHSSPESPMRSRTLAANADGPPIDLSVIDVLLLTSLDPYVARLLGLYWIDTAVLPGKPVDYKVEGVWGERRLWPLESLTFAQVSREQIVARQFSVAAVAGEDVHIFTGRAVALGDDGALKLSGAASLPLQLTFAQPVQELRLHVSTEATASWEIEALDGTGAVADKNHTYTNGVLTITTTKSIGRLALREQGGRQDTRWRLSRLQYRLRTAGIGTLSSQIEHVNPIGRLSGRREPMPPPRVPDLQRLEVATLSPASDGRSVVSSQDIAPPLTDRGEIPASAAKVAVRAGATEDPFRPVRLHVRRASAPGAAAELLTGGGPSSWPEPELLSFWRLDGDPRDARPPGLALVAKSSAYRALFYAPLNEAWESARRALYLELPVGPDRKPTGQGAFLETAALAALRSLGTQLRLQLWAKPKSGQQFATLIGNNWHVSFWLGLGSTPGGYQVRFWLNRILFLSQGHIGAETWSHIAVSYDGEAVEIWINGRLDSTHAARLGRVQPNPRGTLCIGADSGADAANLTNVALPYQGGLADIQIWRDRYRTPEKRERGLLASWSLNGRLIDVRTQRVAEAVATPRFEPAHPQTEAQVLVLDGTTYVAARDHPLLQQPLPELTIHAWIHPDSGLTTPTVLGNDWRRSFWLGLRTGLSGYNVRLWLNGTQFNSTLTLPAGQWSFVSASYDGQEVRFILNGRLDRPVPARLGPVLPNSRGVLCIGGELEIDTPVTQLPQQPAFPFKGKLADIHVWSRGPRIASPALLRAKSGGTGPDPVDYMDHNVTPGTYRYELQGVDLFGRVSAISPVKEITVADNFVPPPPVNVRGEFLPYTGEIVSADDGHVVTTLALGPSELERRDLEITRAAGDRAIRDTFQIGTIEEPAQRPLRLPVIASPFARFTPAAGDRVELAYDKPVRVTWAWTGIQRLFVPRARRFNLFVARGPVNALGGVIERVDEVDFRTFTVTLSPSIDPAADVSVGQMCRVGQVMFRVHRRPEGASGALQLRYGAWPVVAPKVGDVLRLNLEGRDYSRRESWAASLASVEVGEHVVLEHRGGPPLPAVLMDATQKNRLRASPPEGEGVQWLTDLNTLYAITFTGLTVPEAVRNTSSAQFVPGAVVGFNLAEGANQWQVFTVVWQSWSAETGLTLYFLPADRNPQLPRLTAVRFYPGVRFVHTVVLPDSLLGFPRGEGTAEFLLGVTIVDSGGRESAVGGLARVVAVDRRRPPRPPQPAAEIRRADYHGQSGSTVTWALPDGASEDEAIVYQLYRAADSAIFTRDLEQRRLREGHYQDMTFAEIFADDPDFADWLAARFPEHDADWRTTLFLGERPATPPSSVPRDERTTTERAQAQWDAAWNAATPVWRAWYERFYPALSAVPAAGARISQIEDIAERRGNETAFTLINSSPIRERRYIDHVNGLVRNRYLYRLRTQGASLLRSIEWGPVSVPTAAPKVRPPTTPVIVRVDAGDCNITLSWALNREPHLREYRLYRARTEEELRDLRWWSSGPDPRLIATIPDPRLKISGNELRLPSLDVAEVVGIYLAQDYSGDGSVPGTPRPLNYYRATTNTADSSELVRLEDGHVVRRLRRVAEGAHVVVVYRNSSGETRTLWHLLNGPSYTDTAVIGLTDCAYRLVAADDVGNVSEASRAVRGRAYEHTPPAPPPLDLSVDESGPAVAVSWTPEPHLSYMVQRLEKGGMAWNRITPWLPGGTARYEDHDVVRGSAYTYRLRARSAGGLLNERYVESSITID